MGYLTAKQFSKIWGISERRIIKLCNENRISGAIKNGMVWEIPEETLKPSDKRSSIYKYINIPKRIMIVNSSAYFKEYLLELLEKQGYITEFAELDLIENNLDNLSQYYEGLIYFSKDNMSKNEEDFIKNFSNRMHSETSIVIVENAHFKTHKVEKKLANSLKTKIGLRINSLVLNIPTNDDSLINYNEITEDIVELLLKFKNTTGMEIITDGGKIEFDKYGRTKNLSVGEFYNALNVYFKKLNNSSFLWCASTMLEDEWTESPQEMKFRLINLETANRGVRVERIFIFSKDKVKQFKENKTLKIYMQSNIKTLFVDLDEIKEKSPNLLKIVNSGWDGIDKSTLIVDLPETTKERGYISKNTKEVIKAYNCYQKLKKYSKDLKEILK